MFLKNVLMYITNNEEVSRHEEQFDVLFFLINTLALGVGVWLLLSYDQPLWIPFLIIEYTWALDNMRHNRA